MSSPLDAWLNAPLPVGPAAVDEYRAIRDVRLAMEKEVDRVKERETAIKKSLVDNIPKDTAGLFGLKFKAQITTKSEARAAPEGWPSIHAWIRQTGRFDLLEKRLVSSVALELGSLGTPVPGTVKVNIPDVSVTKV